MFARFEHSHGNKNRYTQLTPTVVDTSTRTLLQHNRSIKPIFFRSGLTRVSDDFYGQTVLNGPSLHHFTNVLIELIDFSVMLPLHPGNCGHQFLLFIPGTFPQSTAIVDLRSTQSLTSNLPTTTQATEDLSAPEGNDGASPDTPSKQQVKKPM